MLLPIRKTYSIIREVMNDDDLTLEQKLKFTKIFKQDLRKVLKPLNINPFEETYHYTDECGESYYIKEFFDEPFTEEEKEEFIKDQWRRIYSPYDCTGLAFTQSIRICNFKEPNSFGAMSVVYHFLALDV